METKKMTYMQAIRLALDEEMARDEKVIMMGQDIGILGGAPMELPAICIINTDRIV